MWKYYYSAGSITGMVLYNICMLELYYTMHERLWHNLCNTQLNSGIFCNICNNLSMLLNLIIPKECQAVKYM